MFENKLKKIYLIFEEDKDTHQVVREIQFRSDQT